MVPKSVHQERVKENIDIFGFSLDSHEMELIDSMNKNKRYYDLTGV